MSRIEGMNLNDYANNINGEGWEGNAAVVVGTREQVKEETKKLLNKETATFVDVRSFIESNFTILATAEELKPIAEELKINLVPGEAVLWGDDYAQLYFISKDLSLKTVDCRQRELNKIRSLPPNSGTQPLLKLWVMPNELENIGFKLQNHNRVGDLVIKVDEVRRKKAQTAKESTEFEF